MKKFLVAASAMSTAMLLADPAAAASCIGNCGIASPNGVVVAPPAGGPSYSYISTDGGIAGAGQIAGVAGFDGSEQTTDSFTAVAGDLLELYFNYVTSDGSGFSDYAFAELRNLADPANPIYLFTARTTPTGNTSPGFGLPANSSTLNPSATPIIGGAPSWVQLGSSSDSCYQGPTNGCGYTGWIKSSYTFASGGSYVIRLGVTNTIDGSFDSGLAYSGITVSTPGGAVPEPATWGLMMLGFGLVGAAARRRKGVAAIA